ncbi:MAG: FecR family protein [Paracoccaceae bacterium]
MALHTKHSDAPINRRLALFGMASAALIGLAGTAAPKPEVGHVASVTGTGYAGDAPLRRLRAKGRLQMGDKVWTEEASRASLILDLGAVVHLGPQAHLILDRFVAQSTGVLTLDAGAMVFDRDDDLPKIDLQIRSAYARIGLRGTRFFAGQNRGMFAVFVDRGEVSVAAGGRQVTLRAGDGIDIAEAGTQPSPVARWQPPRIAEAFGSVLP